MSFEWFVHQCSDPVKSNSVEQEGCDGWFAQDCLGASSKRFQLRAAERSASGGIFWRASSATMEMGLGSLGNGIGSTGQAQEIPDDQEHDSDKLRKRRREVEQPAP